MYGNKELQQFRLENLAKSKNGILLSNYIDCKKLIKIQCEHGHQWETTPDHLFKGTWCPTCVGRNPIEQQKRLKELILYKDGILLSNYVNSHAKVKIICKHGHQWDAAPNNLFKGTWCPTCSKIDKEFYQKRIEELAKSKNGTLISNYINARKKVRIQCEYGHQWDVIPFSLFSNNTWCPHCYKNQFKEKK